jgi:hypothetical protein
MTTENTEKLLAEILVKIDNLNKEMTSEFKQVNNRFNEVDKSIRLVRKLVKPSSSGLREFRTQARIYSKIRVGNSY